jgi:acetyl coenzyme A synthetase (ADP forming)-like protein
MKYQALFYPESIAVIGASRTPQSVGNDLIKNLVEQGYQGKIYPVNPKADEILGQKVYHTVAEIPEKIELALIAVPAKFVPQVLREAADKGAQGAIIISAGFKEVGNVELENEVAQICEEHGIALIGPNCLGVINPEIKMNASFASIMPSAGSIAFVSQSGALCSSVLDYAKEYNLGFSKFLSIGNKAIIDEVALLEYFAADPQTKVIAMYVEQLENANRFIEVARQVTQGENAKPILILKSGRTSAGAAAIASHTGSLAGGDAAYQALFAQSGVIRPNTIRELFEFIRIFAHNEIKPVNNVAIVTNAGGPGVIATDETLSSGLALSKLQPEIQDRLKGILPPAASVKNPVDILGDAKADRYKEALDILAEDDGINSLMVLLTPQTMTEPLQTAQAMIEFKKYCDKPLVVSFMGKETVNEPRTVMERGGVSTTSFPEVGVRGLAAFGRFTRHHFSTDRTPFSFDSIDKSGAAAIIEEAMRNHVNNLPEVKAWEIFEKYGLPTLKRQEIRTGEAARTAAETFKSVVALKIISPDIIHKSDAGGVMLNIEPAEIPNQYQVLLDRVQKNVPTAHLEGVLAVEMAPKGGLEFIVGANEVPGLGKMVMVGLGGIYVEVFKDTAFGYAPLWQEFARNMVESLKTFPILQGTRGHHGYDVEALIEVIGRISQLVTDQPHITELDINPILVLPKGQGVKVLDARILVE